MYIRTVLLEPLNSLCIEWLFLCSYQSEENLMKKVIRYRVNWFNLAILIVATGIVLRLLNYLLNSI